MFDRTATLSLKELLCAGFRHSAGLLARVVLDGAACRLGELEMCVMCWMFLLCGRTRKVKKRRCSRRGSRERTTKDETCNTPDYKSLLDTKDDLHF